MKKHFDLVKKDEFAEKAKTNFYQKTSVFICVNLWLLFLCFTADAQTLAPGAPGKDAQWATAGKQAIGTSASLDSKVWFTLADGVLTEVYYPDVTVANIHLLQFVVVNKTTGKVETEKEDTTQTIDALALNTMPFPPAPGLSKEEAARNIKFGFVPYHQTVNSPKSPSFMQTNWAKDKKWRIRKTYTVDPERNTILIDFEFSENLAVLQKPEIFEVYVYYDPSLNNTGMRDTAWTQDGNLLASDGNKVSALAAEFGFDRTTNGFLGISDGLTQLQSKKALESFDRAENGNVVQVGKLNLRGGELVDSFKTHAKTTLALSFGKTQEEAIRTAKVSLQKGFDKCQTEYEKGWSDYVNALPKVEAKYQAQFNMAAMVLKAQEDKTVRGANVASLTIPWGGGKNANEDVGGGYHLVWARDLYQVFTAYLALGDTAAANRALDFLFNIQQKPDGSFPQNSWLDGRNGWGGLQMDEVGYPLIMAYQLKRFDKATYENHVKKAADFIVKNGPVTPQERWEEKPGYSPSTMAAEIAGLVCAAEIARQNNDETSANLYLKTADDWQSNIEKWTATTNGKFGDGNYYVRLTKNGKPDAGEKIELSNSSGAFPENEIVDAGFLELVRLGIKSPDDPLIVKSLKVIDAQIKVNTPNGESFYRYNHDGYGEQPDGRRWNFDGTYSGTGRLWALLAGERGQYELALQNLNQENLKVLLLKDGKPDPKIKVDFSDTMSSEGGQKVLDTKITDNPKSQIPNPKSRLDAMLNFANEGLMIPEQIWDKAETPKNIDKQFVPELKFGEGTGSATPLAWSMAQFIRLAVNLQAGKNLDTPDVVYNRYVLGQKSEVRSQKSAENQNDDPGNVDINEVPESFVNGIDTRCFSDKPLYKKDCSYVSTIAAVNSQNPVLRPCRIGGFFMACKNSSKEMHVCFGYEKEFKTLEIAGDFTDWKPVALKVIKKKDGNQIDCFNFAKNARVEYKLIVDGKWIADPLNPNKVNNGVGGENSVFTMPDYKPTEWLNWKQSPESPLETIKINSKIYGEREIQIYSPGSFEPLSVMYLQDGSDYQKRAEASRIQLNLVIAKKIKPFIMVFLDPKDRMKEYWANDDYAKFLATEVVPAIDAKYKTIKSRDGRAILGASLGGITSVWVGLKYPEVFSRIGGQSSSFWIDEKRVLKELKNLDANKTKYKFYFDSGTQESEDIIDSREAVEILRQKAFDVTYVEGEAGHNWTSWRDRLADAFIALWK